MNFPQDGSKRLFVIDTNVLMHDPSAFFRFKEHDLYLPMIVIEELDQSKKGLSEVSRNARQVSRFLGDMVGKATREQIKQGLPIPAFKTHKDDELPAGRIFLQTEIFPEESTLKLPGRTADNGILAVVIALQKSNQFHGITLVSKDINMRIKAAMLGIHAEDYQNDRVIEDADLLYSGLFSLPEDFWETHSQGLDSWQEKGHTFYRIKAAQSPKSGKPTCVYTVIPMKIS